MRWSRAFVLGLGGLLVAGVVPGVMAAGDHRLDAGASTDQPSSGQLQQAATACRSQGSAHAVRRPQFVRRIATGETGWFSSPALVDLDRDGRKEIVAPFYSTF